MIPPRPESELQVSPVTPQGVSGCSYRFSNNQTYVSGCRVFHETLTWNAEFTANYNYGIANGHYISSIRNPLTGGIGMGPGTLDYVQRRAPVNGTAIAQLKARQTQGIGDIGVGRDVGFRLHVNTAGGNTFAFGM